VIHCDADLYSSELFVLTSLNRLITAGTILIFDDFGAVNHDFQAFIHYTDAFMLKYRVLAFCGLAYNSADIQVI